MKLRRYRLEWISVRLIDDITIQPEARTRESKLERLCTALLLCGILMPVLVAKKDTRYELIDGYGRYWMAVLKLELEEIPCLVLEEYLSPEEREIAFLCLNTASETMDPCGRAKGRASSVNPDRYLEVLEQLNPAFAKQLVESDDIFGPARARRMFEQEKFTPRVAEHVPKIMKLFAANDLNGVSKRDVGNWMFEHEMFRTIDDMFRNDIPRPVAERLHAAITSNEPYLITKRQ